MKTPTCVFLMVGVLRIMSDAVNITIGALQQWIREVEKVKSEKDDKRRIERKMNEK